MATPNATTSSIISLVMDEVRQSLEPKISHLLTDYQTYKETHDALLKIPFIKHLLDNQCKCHLPQTVPVHEPIHLEIIDGAAHGLPNLDSIAEYINATIDENLEKNEIDSDDEAASESEAEQEDAEEEHEEAVSEVEEEAEAASEAEEEAEAASEAEEETEAASESEEEAEAASEVEAEEIAQEKAPEEPTSASEEEEEEEELELFEVEIKGKTYVTNDEIEGDIYEYVNDEVGEIVGTFKNGVAKLTKKSKSAKK